MSNFTRTHKIVILIVAIVMTVGFGYKTVVDDTNEIEINDEDLFLETEQEGPVETDVELETKSKKEVETLYAEENTAKEVVVHITGEVVRPGIVSLESGGRVIDAIKKAGGLTPYADEKNINLAQKLMDEDKVIIPNRDESAQVEASLSGAGQSMPIETGQSSVSSNNGGDSGSGGVVSQSPQGAESSGGGGQVNINTASKEELKTLSGVGDVTAQKIIDHRESTPFGSIEDIKQVSGIGDKKFDAIKNMITTR